MNCVIIDDDKMSRRVIEEFVKKTEFLNLSSSFSNAVEAINNINNLEETDLVFLDIEMPEMNGMDFLNTLKTPCQVIIISSKDKYALEAFEYDVTDYLLKPIYYSRFYKAVEKAYLRHSKTKEVKEGINEMFVKRGGKLIRIKYDDILYFESSINHVYIATINEGFSIGHSLKILENNLPSKVFLRVHRSFIVNKSKITTIEENNLELDTGKKRVSVPFGKAYRERLLNEIKYIPYRT
jgi:DNA-binding LytR/AlgR family response regulator